LHCAKKHIHSEINFNNRYKQTLIPYKLCTVKQIF
jgi:hypothetical protein